MTLLEYKEFEKDRQDLIDRFSNIHGDLLIDDRGEHYKYWFIEQDGNIVKTTYGRIGSTERSTEKSFSGRWEATDFYHKKLREKLGKGYRRLKDDKNEDFGDYELGNTVFVFESSYDLGLYKAEVLKSKKYTRNYLRVQLKHDYMKDKKLDAVREVAMSKVYGKNHYSNLITRIFELENYK